MDRCPAKGAICHKCSKKGHFGAQCFSKATTNELSLETAFLDAVTTRHAPSWSITLLLQGKEIAFKLDTGAEVTAVSNEVYQTLEGIELQTAAKPLYTKPWTFWDSSPPL